MYVEMAFQLNLYRHSLSRLYSHDWTDIRYSLASDKDMYVEMAFQLNLYRHTGDDNEFNDALMGFYNDAILGT